MLNNKELIIDNENEKYKEEFQMFYENVRNFINYLEENKLLKKYQIRKIKKRLRKVRLSLTKAPYAKVFYDGEENFIPLEDVQGTTVSGIMKGKLQPQICFINLNGITKEETRQVMFHEMMHAASKLIVKEKNNYKFSCGLTFAKYETLFYNFLNEGLTDIVAKRLYDKIYNRPYNVFDIEKNISYINTTLIMYNFTENLTDKELFDIYFNNKIDVFEQIVGNKAGIDLATLEHLIQNYKFEYIESLIEDATSIEKIKEKYY